MEEEAKKGPNNQEKELIKQSLAFLEDVIATLEMFALVEDSNLSKKEKELIEQFLKIIPEDLEEIDKLKITLKKRKVRDEERHFREGDDPGIHLKIEIPDFGEINLNAYGGIRIKGELDYKDTSLNRHHAVRTDQIVSQATQINVNIYDQNSIPVADTWLVLGPVGQNYVKINTLIIKQEGTEVRLGKSLTYPEQTEYQNNRLRNKIKELCQLRSE